jgi:RNA polymerase sigma factor (sigma-70 family)
MVSRAAATHAVPAGTGEEVFLAHLALIERIAAFVCARHHVPLADAEDFSSHVKLKLIEDDYAILRKFEGRSSLSTFLTVVVNRLFLDYRISAWGKWRPSAEARRIGEVAVLLEQLTVRDRCSFEDACERMTANHAVTATRQELEAIAARLPPRVRRQFETDEVLESVATADRSPDDLALDGERQALADRVSAILDRTLRQLDTQDRLILVLHYKDGRTVADIARMLSLDSKRLYRRMERLERGLRETFDAEGIDGTNVLEMLRVSTVSLAWADRNDAESSGSGPSMKKGGQR